MHTCTTESMDTSMKCVSFRWLCCPFTWALSSWKAVKIKKFTPIILCSGQQKDPALAYFQIKTCPQASSRLLSLPAPGLCPFLLLFLFVFEMFLISINVLSNAITCKNHLLNRPVHYVFDTGVVTSGERREWDEEKDAYLPVKVT